MSRQANPAVRSLRDVYRKHFIDHSRSWDSSYVGVDTATAMAVADAYERQRHAPADPYTMHCYEVFCNETRLQWQWLIGHGFVVEPWKDNGQPYVDSREMMKDVRTGHLSFFLTDNGYGDAEQLDHSNNPLLQKTDVVVSGVRLRFNDLFRAVHDVFGHATEGYQFGPRGEENAWRSHSAMYTWTARRAMTTETRGQNCWVNFGPHMRDSQGRLLQPSEPGYLRPDERPYANQKVCLLPAWISEVEGCFRSGIGATRMVVRGGDPHERLPSQT